MKILDTLGAAARGECSAFADLATHSLDCLVAEPRQAMMRMGEALTLGRLAALAGSSDEMKRLAGILFLYAQMMADQSGVAVACDDADDAGFYEVEGCEAMAEALYWLDLAADGGDDDATDFIQLAADMGIPPEAFTLASKFASQSKEPA